jgi:ACS family phthalate transporter-like MFS transporter
VAATGNGRHPGFLRPLADGRVYLLAVAFCCTIMCTGNVVQIWAPLILKDAGLANVLQVGWLAGILWAVGVVVMLLVSRHSERHRERRRHFVTLGVVVAVNMLALPGLAHQATSAVVGYRS